MVSTTSILELTYEQQIDKFLKGGAFTDRQGNFNYREWVKVLRVNEDNDDEKAPP